VAATGPSGKKKRRDGAEGRAGKAQASSPRRDEGGGERGGALCVCLSLSLCLRRNALGFSREAPHNRFFLGARSAAQLFSRGGGGAGKTRRRGGAGGAGGGRTGWGIVIGGFCCCCCGRHGAGRGSKVGHSTTTSRSREAGGGGEGADHPGADQRPSVYGIVTPFFWLLITRVILSLSLAPPERLAPPAPCAPATVQDPPALAARSGLRHARARERGRKAAAVGRLSRAKKRANDCGGPGGRAGATRCEITTCLKGGGYARLDLWGRRRRGRARAARRFAQRGASARAHHSRLGEGGVTLLPFTDTHTKKRARAQDRRRRFMCRRRGRKAGRAGGLYEGGLSPRARRGGSCGASRALGPSARGGGGRRVGDRVCVEMKGTVREHSIIGRRSSLVRRVVGPRPVPPGVKKGGMGCRQRGREGERAGKGRRLRRRSKTSRGA
jgi:hypothetical protein